MSRLSLEFNNGQAIHDSDADIWFQALQYAVEYGNFELAEEFHEEGQSLVNLFIDVEKGVEEDKCKNYCDACGHHKNSHYKTGEKLPFDHYGDGKEYDEWHCEEENDLGYYCECDDLVVDERNDFNN